MKADNHITASDTALLATLGRLRADQKQLFLKRAREILSSMSAAEKAKKWSPSSEHNLALADLNDKCRALALALERVSRTGVPESYIREAWAIAVNIQGAPDAPFPLELPTTLRYLALAARIWLPDAKPRHRPRENSISTFVVRVLAASFQSAFCKRPTIGTNSPFVKFCHDALPAYGFDVPSLPKLKRLIGWVADE